MSSDGGIVAAGKHRCKDATIMQAELFLAEETEWDSQLAITITGYRYVDETAARSLINSVLQPRCGKGRIWLLGGARGVDTWATEWLLDNSESCYVVVPFSVADQPEQARPVIERATRIIELKQKKSKRAYILRNQFMVDRSRSVIAFWSGQQGGTLSTVKYALRKKLEVHVHPVPER